MQDAVVLFHSVSLHVWHWAPKWKCVIGRQWFVSWFMDVSGAIIDIFSRQCCCEGSLCSQGTNRDRQPSRRTNERAQNTWLTQHRNLWLPSSEPTLFNWATLINISGHYIFRRGMPWVKVLSIHVLCSIIDNISSRMATETPLSV